MIKERPTLCTSCITPFGDIKIPEKNFIKILILELVKKMYYVTRKKAYLNQILSLK